MSRILAILTGCLLVAGLLAALPVATASGTPCGPCQFGPGSFLGYAMPVRALDTRSGLGGRLGAVAPGHTVTAHITTAGTPAAIIEVTVPGIAPNGSLSVYPSNTAWSGRVTMTLVSGGPIQQQLTVRLGADGGVTVRNNSTRAVHLVVDTLGSYQAGTPAAGGTFAALNSRILDTRATSPLPGGGHTITLSLPGHGGIPAAGAEAVVLNIAVLSARANGLLSVTDGDRSQATLHMRFVRNQPMQTERVVKVGTDGTLTFSQSSAASVQLVIDLMGYFLPYSATVEDVDGSYVPWGVRPIASLQPPVGRQLRLYQHQPLEVGTGTSVYWALAYNMVLSNDRPGQPALLGAYNSPDHWNYPATVSSTPAGQTTELTLPQSVWPEGNLTLVNRTSATWTYLHGYVTGYYWYFHCTFC